MAIGLSVVAVAGAYQINSNKKKVYAEFYA